MNRKISLGAAVAFMLIVAAATFSATMVFALSNFNQRSADLEQRREMYEKFADVDSTVRENYGGTINETLLMDSVAQGYMKGIGDKYGLYINAEEYKRMTRNKEGEDIGIGAVLDISTDGYLSVIEVYPDSPAQVAGIAAGDLIVKVDDVNLTQENVEHYYNSIQGAAGTKVSLVVRKGSEDIPIPGLTRRVVAVPSVYSRIIPDTEVGYILIKQFNDNTADQFNRELRKVIDAGAKCLIFDLRDNKGSSLPAAVRMLDSLVPEGVIYSAVYKDGTVEVKEYASTGQIDLPMTVLTNSATASAAELFAQDLKDFGKASIVGSATMGKGVMLNRINLSDGSAIELTVAQMASAAGTVFDEVGIKPDYDVFLDGDWTKLDETTDVQLKKAIEVVSALRKAEATIQAEASSQPEAQSEPEVQQPSPAPAPTPEESSAPPDEESSEESSSESEEESSGDETESGNEGESENSEPESSSSAPVNPRLDRDPEE